MKPYYKTLKVSEEATQEEIKQSYRILSKAWHPDKHNGKDTHDVAEEYFKRINEAYSVLSDPEKRKNYDKTGLIEGSSIEDQAKEVLIQIFEAAIDVCIERGKDKDVMFTKVHEAIKVGIEEEEGDLDSHEMAISELERKLDKISELKSKSSGEAFKKAIERYEKKIEAAMDLCKQEIMLLERDIVIKKLVFDMMVEYPKEPEKQKEVSSYDQMMDSLSVKATHSIFAPRNYD